MTNVTLDHVGLPARASELDQISLGLQAHFGARLLGQGSSPTRRSVWLTLGSLEIHLIANEDLAEIKPGATHSPHICVKVDDLDRLRSNLEQADIPTWQAGTLPGVRQLWAALSPCFVIEIQEVGSQSS